MYMCVCVCLTFVCKSHNTVQYSKMGLFPFDTVAMMILLRYSPVLPLPSCRNRVTKCMNGRMSGWMDR